MIGTWYGILSGCLKPEKKKNGDNRVLKVFQCIMKNNKNLHLIILFQNLKIILKRIMTLIVLH